MPAVRWLVRLALLLLLHCRAAVGAPAAATHTPAIVFATYGPQSSEYFVAIEYARLSHPESQIFLGASEDHATSCVCPASVADAQSSPPPVVHNYTDASNDGRVPAQWAHNPEHDALLARLSVKRLFVQPEATPLHAQLMRSYRHGSAAPLVYERFCMARFISLAHVMEAEGLRSALFVNADILLFSNVFDAFGDAADWGMGSFMSFWTAHRASQFASFIANFFSEDPSRDAALLAAHGSAVPPSYGEAYARLVDQQASWWPAERAAGPRFYITDMELYRVWAADAPAQRNGTLMTPAAWSQRCGVYATAPVAPRAASAAGAKEAAAVSPPAAVSCPMLSALLCPGGPADPRGCHNTGAVARARLHAAFAFAPRGGIRLAPRMTVDGVDLEVVSIHFNGWTRPLLADLGAAELGGTLNIRGGGGAREREGAGR